MLTGTTRRLTAAEEYAEPRHLGVIAWFDGNARAHNPSHQWATYPRRLLPDEEKCWREGWMDGLREKRCHDAHGFDVCDGSHVP